MKSPLVLEKPSGHTLQPGDRARPACLESAATYFHLTSHFPLQFVLQPPSSPGPNLPGRWRSAAREYARHRLGVAIVPLATIRSEDQKDFVIRRLPDYVAIVEYLIHRPADLNTGQRALKDALLRAAQPPKRKFAADGKGCCSIKS